MTEPRNVKGLGKWLAEIKSAKKVDVPKRPKGIVVKGCVAYGTTPEASEWLEKYSGGIAVSREAMEFLIATDSPLLRD